MARHALAGEISTAVPGCYLTEISLCSLCACPLADMITNLTAQFQQSTCARGIGSARRLKCKETYHALPKKCESKTNNNVLIFLCKPKTAHLPGKRNCNTMCDSVARCPLQYQCIQTDVF